MNFNFLRSYYFHPAQLSELEADISDLRIQIETGEEFQEWLKKQLRKEKWETLRLDKGETMAELMEKTYRECNWHLMHLRNKLDALREQQQLLVMEEI